MFARSSHGRLWEEFRTLRSIHNILRSFYNFQFRFFQKIGICCKSYGSCHISFTRIHLSIYSYRLYYFGFQEFWSSYRKCSIKNAGLNNFSKFTGKYLCQGLFFNKVTGPTLLKMRLWHRCFPVNFAKCLRTLLLQNISRRFLLEMGTCSIFPEASF